MFILQAINIIYNTLFCVSLAVSVVGFLVGLVVGFLVGLVEGILVGNS